MLCRSGRLNVLPRSETNDAFIGCAFRRSIMTGRDQGRAREQKKHLENQHGDA